MVAPTIRGHQAYWKLFQDGREIVIDSVTKVSISQDSNFSRHLYVGNPIPQGDQIFQGWTGQVSTEVRDATVENFIDALVTRNLNGIGISDCTFIIRELYADGSQSGHVYTNCFFKMSREQSGLEAKIMKNLDWQSSYRARIL